MKPLKSCVSHNLRSIRVRTLINLKQINNLQRAKKNLAPNGIECSHECGNQEQVLHLCQSQMSRCLIMTTHVFYHLGRNCSIHLFRLWPLCKRYQQFFNLDLTLIVLVLFCFVWGSQDYQIFSCSLNKIFSKLLNRNAINAAFRRL